MNLNQTQNLRTKNKNSCFLKLGTLSTVSEQIQRSFTQFYLSFCSILTQYYLSLKSFLLSLGSVLVQLQLNSASQLNFRPSLTQFPPKLMLNGSKNMQKSGLETNSRRIKKVFSWLLINKWVACQFKAFHDGFQPHPTSHT